MIVNFGFITSSSNLRSCRDGSSIFLVLLQNQRTNGPVSAHLRSDIYSKTFINLEHNPGTRTDNINKYL